MAATAGVTGCEPPFGTAELIEAAWWHPTRSGDPALRWLRSIVAEVAKELLPAAYARYCESIFPRSEARF